jgi:hypothetical protein
MMIAETITLMFINLSNPSGYFMYHQVEYLKILLYAHRV